MAGAALQTFPCNICALARATRPAGTSCGHTFCWSCLHRYFSRDQPRPCPSCGTMLKRDKFHVTPLFLAMNNRPADSELILSGPSRLKGSALPPHAPIEEDSLRRAGHGIPGEDVDHVISQLDRSSEASVRDDNLIGSWDTAFVQWEKNQKRRLQTRHSGVNRTGAPTPTVWVELDREGRFNWEPAPVRRV